MLLIKRKFFTLITKEKVKDWKYLLLKMLPILPIALAQV